MGRYLDSAEIARLGQLTVPTLAFTPVNDPLVPPALLSAPGSGGGSRPTMVQPVNRTAVSGYVLFRDIYGRNALVLSITEPRDIYNEGLGTAFQFVIIILGAGLLLGIVVIILLDRLVLARIGSLALQVSSIGQDRDLTRRVAIGGSDQLADLGSVINRMLETIEKTQNSLVQSEARFRELAELLPQTVFEMDMQGSLTFINDAGAEIFGIDDEKIQEGTNVREYLIPEDLERMRQGLAVVMAGAKSSGEIYHLKRLDGTLMSAIVYTSPVHRDGTITGFRGIVTDITDRVKLEEALIESEEKYRALTENTADIPFLTDMQGVLQYISPQIGRFGFGTSEIVNKNILDLVYPDDRFSVGNYLKTEIGSNRRQGHVFRITEKSGTIHWMEANTTIKRGNGGRPEGIYGTLRDITDRKRDEDALRLANRKLNLMNTITRHDILNTITGLLGCVDMAASVTDKVEHDALLAQIKEQARIIQRQITFTREYQEVGIHAPVWQNLNEILERVIGNFSRTGITFVMDLDHMEIYADPLLEKVFYNLIDNALRYGKTLTTIRFYNQISDKGMAIICDDDGAGIPAKEKERIFEQGVGQNTGMGLFLTREMLIITGITLRETGTFGQGARFEMLVPNSAWRLVRAGTER
jgi:PAS domain S-box-containing protein